MKMKMMLMLRIKIIYKVMDYTEWITQNGLHRMDYTEWITQNGLHRMDYTEWITQNEIPSTPQSCHVGHRSQEPPRHS
jgi:hypothetical protein